MSDIFISYATHDRAIAQLFAEALQHLGWSVWWDKQIPPGKTFDQVIEEQLSAARCVIVLWSKASVSSRWVKTEASEGAAREILVPVLIDSVAIPLEFRRIQAAHLIDWRGTETHSEFTKLVQAIESVLGQPGLSTNMQSLTPQKSATTSPLSFPRRLLAILVVMCGMSALAFVNVIGFDILSKAGAHSVADAFVAIIWLIGGPSVIYLAWKLWDRKRSR